MVQPPILPDCRHGRTLQSTPQTSEVNEAPQDPGPPGACNESFNGLNPLSPDSPIGFSAAACIRQARADQDMEMMGAQRYTTADFREQLKLCEESSRLHWVLCEKHRNEYHDLPGALAL